MKENRESITNTTSNNTKIYQTKSRPRPVYQWSAHEVTNWYKRHCEENTPENAEQKRLYSDFFVKNDIVGKVLLRITDKSLEHMGIINNQHREHIWREIVKLKLKTDIMEIKDLERVSIENEK